VPIKKEKRFVEKLQGVDYMFKEKIRKSGMENRSFPDFLELFF
jgi:hypothetical protein